MGLQLTGMSLKNLVRKPITRRYPFEPQQYTERSRGHIENDIDVCILCGICEKKCPAVAIKVDKPAGTWMIDPFSCVQCNACVRACPKDCLSMLPSYTAVAAEKSTITLYKPPVEEKSE